MLYTQSLNPIRIDAGSLVDAAARAMSRAIVAPFVALWWLLSALVTHWRPIALCAGIVAAVAVCVAYPVIPLALGSIAAYAVVTRPRVSWNSSVEVSA